MPALVGRQSRYRSHFMIESVSEKGLAVEPNSFDSQSNAVLYYLT
jgi:hypothetical protein